MLVYAALTSLWLPKPYETKPDNTWLQADVRYSLHVFTPSTARSSRDFALKAPLPKPIPHRPSLNSPDPLPQTTLGLGLKGFGILRSKSLAGSSLDSPCAPQDPDASFIEECPLFEAHCCEVSLNSEPLNPSRPGQPKPAH